MIVAMKHEKRRFVEHVDFITSPGCLRGGKSRAESGLPEGGMFRVVTDLAVFSFDETRADEGAGAQSRRHAGAGSGQHRLRACSSTISLASPSRRPSTSSPRLRSSTPTGSSSP